MSKRRSSHEHQSLVAKLPSEWPGAPSGPDEQQQAREWLTQVATIRDAIAPLILATGVHQGDDWVEAVAEFLNEDCLVIRDDIQRLDERLHQQGIDTEIHCADFRGPDSRDVLSNAIVTLGNGYGRAGYVLGLAVGMRLGAQALAHLEAVKGGGR